RSSGKRPGPRRCRAGTSRAARGTRLETSAIQGRQPEGSPGRPCRLLYTCAGVTFIVRRSVNLALRYRWDGGGTHVYQVSVEADQGDHVEVWEGHAIYTVRRDGRTAPGADDATFTLTTRGGLSGRRRTKPGGLLPPGIELPVIPAFPRGPFPGNLADKEVRMDASGRLLKRGSGTPLPLALGDLSELVIDPLPDTGALRRQVDDTCTLSESRDALFPGLPRGLPPDFFDDAGLPGPMFGPFGPRPATYRAQ